MIKCIDCRHFKPREPRHDLTGVCTIVLPVCVAPTWVRDGQGCDLGGPAQADAERDLRGYPAQEDGTTTAIYGALKQLTLAVSRHFRAEATDSAVETRRVLYGAILVARANLAPEDRPS